ncbi:hypothetical protein GRJ2_000121600 [Grus japonensis]|uniref:Uncharacterized protein n=1 Tax=Grus japonensis TaxID=30415 RepID=A0ABC9VSZ8_GRUJA
MAARRQLVPLLRGSPGEAIGTIEGNYQSVKSTMKRRAPREVHENTFAELGLKAFIDNTPSLSRGDGHSLTPYQ